MADTEEKVKSKRPADTKFKQQRLPAWKPVLTPRSVLPWIFAFGIIFLAVGIGLIIGSNKVKEQIFDYTDCVNVNTTKSDNGTTCASLLEDYSNGYTNVTELQNRCMCELTVDLDQGFDSDSNVYVYYALENFYQNHRSYVSSRWDAQLRSVTTRPGSDCAPLERDADGNPYAPCGLIANSLFNDTIEVFSCNSDACDVPTKVMLSGRDISWKSDRRAKFKNPPYTGSTLCSAEAFVDSAKPINWPVPVCKLGTSGGPYHAQDPIYGSNGEGYENEDLIVWMRTAAFPNFRKLYRRVVDTSMVADGKFKIRIGYNFPVSAFDGRKKVVISTTSFQGGKNDFLGICYLVVGVLCMISVLVFMVLMRFKGRELGSDAHLSW